MKVLLLGQTQSSPNLEDGLQNLDLKDISVLQYVVRSDEKREKLTREANALEKALEASASDTTAAVRALRKVEFERLEKKVEEAEQIAQRRSGARGKGSRKVLIALEEELNVAKERLDGDVSVDEMSSETQSAAELLTEVQTSLELVSQTYSSPLSAKVSEARCPQLGLQELRAGLRHGDDLRPFPRD